MDRPDVCGTCLCGHYRDCEWAESGMICPIDLDPNEEWLTDRDGIMRRGRLPVSSRIGETRYHGKDV